MINNTRLASYVSRPPYEKCMEPTKYLGVSRNSKKTDDHITYAFGGMRDGFKLCNAEIRNTNTFRFQYDLHFSASGIRRAFKINAGMRNSQSRFLFELSLRS